MGFPDPIAPDRLHAGNGEPARSMALPGIVHSKQSSRRHEGACQRCNVQALRRRQLRLHAADQVAWNGTRTWHRARGAMISGHLCRLEAAPASPGPIAIHYQHGLTDEDAEPFYVTALATTPFVGVGGLIPTACCSTCSLNALDRSGKPTHAG
jgi:hypothetical protein